MNIILIHSDTFRYDNLFDRAEMPVRTPNLDHFAERAVSLTQYYTGSFPTIPERTDFISGRLGWPWYPWQSLLQSTQNWMPRLLKAEGFATQLICDCPHLFNASFQKAFDAAVALRGHEGDLYFLRLNHEIAEVMPREKTRRGHHFQDHTLVDLHCWTHRYWRGEDDTFPPRTAALAVEWLEENYQYHPFFLWVDFFDPHEPWDPPEYLVKRYDPDYAGTPMLHPNYGKATDYTPEELKNLRAHYCAEAELVDRWTGRILQKIDDLRLWDNTMVIFTTDHGTSLGEHNRTGKTNINDGDDRFWPLYPEIAHIPFLVAAPDLEPGTSVDALLQPVDILPTFLDLIDAEGHPPEPFHGRSFAPSLRGEAMKPVRDFAICNTYTRSQDNEMPGCATTPMLYTGQWAYAPVGVVGGPELYDLEKDPLAEENVAHDHPGVTGDLHDRLLAWLRKIDAPDEIAGMLG